MKKEKKRKRHTLETDPPHAQAAHCACRFDDWNRRSLADWISSLWSEPHLSLPPSLTTKTTTNEEEESPNHIRQTPLAEGRLIGLSHRRRTWRWKKMHRNEKSNTWPRKDNPLNSFSLVCNCGVKVDRPIRDDVIETPPKKKRNWSIFISLTLIDTGPRHLYIKSFPNQTTGITTSRRTDDRGWVWIVEMFHGKGIMNQSKSLNW